MRRKFVYFPIRCCGYWKIFRETSSHAAPPDQGETPAPAPAPSEDPKQKLSKLKEMLDVGLITEAEYESKKAEILADI